MYQDRFYLAKPLVIIFYIAAGFTALVGGLNLYSEDYLTGGILLGTVPFLLTISLIINILTAIEENTRKDI